MLKAFLRQVSPPVLLTVFKRLRHPPLWRKTASDPRRNKLLPSEVVSEHDCLAVLAASVSWQKAAALNVVDSAAVSGFPICI